MSTGSQLKTKFHPFAPDPCETSVQDERLRGEGKYWRHQKARCVGSLPDELDRPVLVEGASRRPLLLGVPLKLPQQAVAALDRVIHCDLRILFAGEGRFEFLGDDVADLPLIAEAQPARVLG